MRNLTKFQENKILNLIFDYFETLEIDSGEDLWQIETDFEEALELVSEIADVIFNG